MIPGYKIFNLQFTSNFKGNEFANFMHLDSNLQTISKNLFLQTIPLDGSSFKTLLKELVDIIRMLHYVRH